MILSELFWESLKPYFLSRARELVEEAWAQVCEDMDTSLKNELREALSGAFKKQFEAGPGGKVCRLHEPLRACR